MAAARRRLRLTASLLVFAAFPVLMLSTYVGVDEDHLVDFRYQWQAATDVLAGASPYHPSPDPSVPVTTDCVAAAPDCFVYPPSSALFNVPFAALPFDAAGVLWIVLSIAALLLALRLVGVQDWRCYGVAFASGPVLSSLQGGTMTPLLALGVAVAWRYRDRRSIAAPALAAVIALKLFLWPLGLWFLATRRGWTAVAAGALAAGATLVSWAAIGFAGLADYPSLLGTVSDVWAWRAYTPAALGLALGLPDAVASAISFALGGAALIVVVLLARRGDDRRSFAATIAAALLLSPIVWLHYFVLPLLALGLARPRLSPAWALPFALLFLPGMAGGEVPVLVVGLLLAGAMLAPPGRLVRRREDALGRPPAIAS